MSVCSEDLKFVYYRIEYDAACIEGLYHNYQQVYAFVNTYLIILCFPYSQKCMAKF